MITPIHTRRVRLQARTHEKVDSVGECRAIECHVVAVIERQPGAPEPNAPIEA